jgi:hypothetical protein
VPTYNGPAQLFQRASVVDVWCVYDRVREEPSGLMSWFGTWRDPQPAHTLELGDAILRLPTEHKGRIIIDEINIGSRTTAERGSFTGVGAQPLQ